MKRSEAVKIICDTYNYSADLIEYMTDTQAELILAKLETAGMLPPPISIPEEKIDESVHRITYEGEVCEWEQEDKYPNGKSGAV